MSLLNSPHSRQTLAEFRSAWLLLTVLPCPVPASAQGGSEAGKGLWAYPLVGVCVGLVAAFVFQLTSQLGLPPLAAAGLTLAVLLAATGALHEDGLADFADGLGGRTPERRLEIMRDHATGAYGVSAVATALLLRFAAIASLTSPAQTIAALVASAALSRAVLPLIVYSVPAARADGLGRSVHGVGGREVLAAIAAGAVATMLTLPLLAALASIVLVLAIAAAAGRISIRLIGGHSGDALGAVQQLCEIAVLLAVVALT